MDQEGITCEFLANKLDVSSQSISLYRNGTIPGIDKLIMLSEFFHYSVNDLVKYDISSGRVKHSASRKSPRAKGSIYDFPFSTKGMSDKVLDQLIAAHERFVNELKQIKELHNNEH